MIQTEKYTGVAVLLSRPLLLDVQVTGQPLEVPGDATRDVETTARLVGQDDVLREAAARLGPPYTPKLIEDNTDIEAQGQSNLVTVEATDESPEGAARLANTLAESFIALRRRAVDEQLQHAIAEIRQQLAARPRPGRLSRTLLRTNLTKLELLESVNTSDVQLADRADAPTKPSSPRVLLNLVIGACLGLLLGIALALIAEQLDRPLRRPEDLERNLAMPLLASVPRSKALKARRRKRALGAGELESFRRLRANLLHRNGDRPVRSVLVTSAAAGSGTTTVALHLAASVAAAGVDVLLIEADLRRPSVAGRLELAPESGLSTLLATPEDEGQLPTVPAPVGLDGVAGGRTFEVLAAGASRADASELLDSDEMRQLLDSAVSRFDLVIIDGPPLSVVSDAVPLLGLVDGVIVVARIGRDTQDDLRDLRTYLQQLDVRPLGAVANFSGRARKSYPSGAP